MKVSLTKTELLQVLTEHFRCEVKECVIAKPFVLYGKLNVAVKKEIAANNKIAAIKLLRTLVHQYTKNDLGLADSKWAVENWDKWIEFVKVHGRVPIIKTDPYSMGEWTRVTLS